MRCLYPGFDGQISFQSQVDEGTFVKTVQKRENGDLKYSAITENALLYHISANIRPTYICTYEVSIPRF